MNGKSSIPETLRCKLSSFYDDKIAHELDAIIIIKKSSAILKLGPFKVEVMFEKVTPGDIQSLHLELCKSLFSIDNYFTR